MGGEKHFNILNKKRITIKTKPMKKIQLFLLVALAINVTSCGSSKKTSNNFIDKDGDNIADEVDRCPNERGPIELFGCPGLLAEDQEIVDRALKNIEFDSGKADIRVSSFEPLDYLAKTLAKYPQVKFEIANHSDIIGSAQTNLRLTEERAQAIVDYLVQKGVDANQLIAVGYGEEKPIADSETREGRMKNRRTEIKILTK